MLKKDYVLSELSKEIVFLGLYFFMKYYKNDITPAGPGSNQMFVTRAPAIVTRACIPCMPFPNAATVPNTLQKKQH
jgi:hypothetical protein